MVTQESIEQQLKEIHFNHRGWGRTELRELPHIIMPDEEIYECANGIYEGGFALLVATNLRVLLVDKKPLNYLTIEDLRFDMINEIDYSHRLIGAQIKIATGYKTLHFTSYNQPRLRKLITHVQACMAESKKKQESHEEEQQTHLEQINQQLQAYLLAQHQQQQRIQEHLEKNNRASASDNLQPVKPDPELSDYLYAQSLLAQYQQNLAQQQGRQDQDQAVAAPASVSDESRLPSSFVPAAAVRSADLYEEGMREIFGKHQAVAAAQPQPATSAASQHALDVNPLRIAYSRLPLAMRNKRFGRPSFHAHSQEEGQGIVPIAVTPGEAVPAHS